MAMGDVNGDGRLDVLAANPAKARIECLLQRDPDGPADEDEENGEDDDINALENAGRLKSRSFAVEKRVYGLLVADLNGDGLQDLAYYGEPRELVVVEQAENGNWGAKQTFDIPDGSRNPGALATGDFNGDGKTDLLMVGRNALYLILQEEGGELAPAVKLPSSTGASGFLLVGDFDGNGLDDIAYPVNQQETPLCLRLQVREGGLGPERFVEMSRFRAAAVARRDGDPQAALAVILAASGRVELRRVAEREGASSRLEDAGLLLYPLEEDSSDRQCRLADVDGDGRLDVVVTYPSTAQVGVLFQAGGGALTQPVLYPSFSGLSGLAVGDLDGDERDEVVVLSKEEEAIGFSTWEQTGQEKGRLGFPRGVPVAGRPLALTVEDINGDGRDDIVYVRKQDDKYYVCVRTVQVQGQVSEEWALELEKLDTDVSGLVATDLNRDGHPDVLAFVSFGPARLLLGDGEGGLKDVGAEPSAARTVFRRLKDETVSFGDIDGDGTDELLVAQKNFARALAADEAGSPEVIEQANGKSARSNIASAAVADLDGDGSPEVLLLDTWAKEVTVLRRQEDGTLGAPRSIGLGGMSFKKLLVADLSGDDRPDMVLVSQNAVGVVPWGGARTELELVADYESDTENATLGDLVAGDLFGDGRDELVATDIRNHNLELLRWTPEDELKRVYRFTVFEKKVFRGREQGGNEPRQVILDDLTADGKPDIVLLVHDRIALYPQAVPSPEAGGPQSAEGGEK